jgi:hypothetical protein
MNGIQIEYAELFRLSVEQLFYQNRLYKQNTITPELDILIVPTDDCLNAMNRMNLVFKNTSVNSGFIILARVAGTNGAGNDLIKFPARKNDILSFLMILKNHDAINFNDLPVQYAPNKIYYFNNEVNDVAALRNNLHLSKGAAGVDGTNDSIKTSTENYRFHNTATVAQGTARVKHTLSGQIVEPTLIANQGDQSDLSFNLSTLPIGKCELLINNLLADEFYYLERYSTQAVFGIIELSLSDAIASNYRIIESDRSLTPERPLYLVRFTNRETFWRYTIRLQNTSPLYLEIEALSTPADKTDFINHLNIVTNDSTITFSRISNTDTEFVFVSDSEIFLQEKYLSTTSSTTHGSRIVFDPLNITLKKYITDANEAPVKSNLPFPQTSSIDASALPKIYSDIFLTL